ncbi:MAG: ribokinase [Planctomycetota bacterium]
MAGKIVVVGSSNTDMTLKMDHIPRPGETVLGGRFSMSPGGKGANQAVAAARAGGRVSFLARVGDDMFGRRAIERFQQDGIDVEQVIRDGASPSGVALIFVAADGENSIGVASGANARLSPADIERNASLIAEADVLVMQLETPLETVDFAASIGSRNGATVILDPAPAQPLHDDLLHKVSILTPNESEAELLTGIAVSDESGAAAAAKVLRGKGIGTVIVTLGARGAYVSSELAAGLVPAFQVSPIDTTAAGDVFNGALAVALSQQQPLQAAVRFAAAAAACSVTALGAQPSAPSKDDIDRRLTGSRFNGP